MNERARAHYDNHYNRTTVFLDDKLCSPCQTLEQAEFDCTEIAHQPPRLFTPTKASVRAALRLLNRVRYEWNRLMHLALYTLHDQRPLPSCFEASVELLGYRALRDH